MNKIKSIIIGTLIAVTFITVSCKKTDDQNLNKIALASKVTGTYSGNLLNSQTNATTPATIKVTTINDSLVSLYCQSSIYDTTVTMMLYENNDSIMMCYSGDDFYNEYGHNLDNHNFCNSQSNGWSSGWENNHDNWYGNSNNMWNAWNNHMNTQHKAGDRHYGAFDLSSSSCNYSFQIGGANSSIWEYFSGTIK